MTNPPADGVLSTAAKQAVVSMMRANSRTSASTSHPAAATRAECSRPAISFAELPAYQELKKQAAAAELLGVELPFFRVHAGRAGATTRIAGREIVNFGSYDYLGLNQHPEVAAAAKAGIDTFGTSVSASRVIAGERPLHRQLERQLAAFCGVDDAVVFVSGYGTNVAVIAELMGPRDLILTDALIHHSVLAGAGLSPAARRSYAHNDLASLEHILREARHRFNNVLIVTEGLYSMDGDVPDLPGLIEIKRRYGAWLMIDEAHSLGVLGPGGRGLAEHFGVDPRDVDIWMGTLSKTLAACGGFIAGPTPLIEIMKCRASGFVFSAGLPAPLAAAASKALEILQREPDRVRRLRRNGLAFLERARAHGLDTGLGQGFAIMPIMVGDSLRAAKLANCLLDRGINVVPIVYPAVPMRSARLRFFISADHTPEQAEAALSATKEELSRLVAMRFGLSEALSALAEADPSGSPDGASPWRQRD